MNTGAVIRICPRAGENTKHASVVSTVAATLAHAQRVRWPMGLLAGAPASVVLVVHVRLAKPNQGCPCVVWSIINN